MIAGAALLAWNYFLIRVMADELSMNDFGKFYYSARAFLRGGDLYGPSPATLMPVGHGEYRHFLNLNPPHFHLLVLPLAPLPPDQALAIWLVINCVALVISVRLIISELQIVLTPIRVIATSLGLLAFAGTGAEFATGQLAFLLVLLVTAMWRAARHDRWFATALLLGCGASIKPFLLVFVPYFLAHRRYRAVATTVLTAGVWFAVGIVVFGSDQYVAWIHTLGSENWSWAAMNGSIRGFLDRSLAASPYYEPVLNTPGVITPIWVVATVAVGFATVIAIRRRAVSHGVDADFALLLVFAQLASPLGWIYYVAVPAGPLIALFTRPAAVAASASRHIRPAGLPTVMLIVSCPFLLVPLAAVTAFQPSSLATATIGSSYFWATFAIWLALVAHVCFPRANQAVASAHENSTVHRIRVPESDER